MPLYTYTARESNGQSVTGSITAADAGEALRILRSEGRYPISIQEASTESNPLTGSASRGIRISRSEVIHISNQLSVMVETGVPLSDALDCIARQADKPTCRALLEDLAQQLQGGASFSEAIARHPRSFPSLYVALIRASEKTGMLGRFLQRATAYLRDEQDVLRRVRGSMIYPAIMFAFALLTTLFLLTFVLPRFTVIYASKKAVLPLPTQLLMDLSSFIVRNWAELLAATLLTVVSLVLYFRGQAGSKRWHYIQLHFPILGTIYRRLQLARSLRMIGTMAGAGVPLMDCVVAAEALCPNSLFRDLWKSVAEQIQVGRQLSEPLFRSPLVPRSVAQMVSSGEKSGKLATVMEQIACFAEAELKDQIAHLTRYIEPAMIVIMGLIVGGISLAMLLPVFTISRVIAAH